MSRVDAAAADRLPWLPDEPLPSPMRQPRRTLLPLAAGAILVVAVGAFWVGVRSVDREVARPSYQPAPTATVRLPEPSSAAAPEVRMPPQPQVRELAAPEVRPTPVREIRIVSPRASKSAPSAAPAAKATDQERPPASGSSSVPPLAASPFVPPAPWNPRVLGGAAGRVVQIGAFGTTHQAKRGWWFMVRAYPAVAHLPAVVRTSRNSRGHVFYRFQIGTTSQAHSEILCQRMQRIGLSCAVVGLPWKAKVER